MNFTPGSAASRSSSASAPPSHISTRVACVDYWAGAGSRTARLGRAPPARRPARTRTAVGEFDHYSPPSRLPGPPEGPGAFCLRVGVRPGRRACSTDDDPVPRLHSGEVALHVRRHSGPRASPSMGPGPTIWLARVAKRTRQRMLARTTCLPAVVATHRFDHLPVTVHPLGGSFIPQSPATRRHRSRREVTTENGEATAARYAAAPIPQMLGREPLVSRPDSSPFNSLEHPGTRAQHQSQTLPRHRCGPDARPASLRPQSTLQVRVAALAGPAPPSATCGRPEARPASA